MSETVKHEFGPNGECVACKQTSCGDAFWAYVGKGINMPPAPSGTRELRLRPGKAPEWIPPEEPKS